MASIWEHKGYISTPSPTLLTSGVAIHGFELGCFELGWRRDAESLHIYSLPHPRKIWSSHWADRKTGCTKFYISTPSLTPAKIRSWEKPTSAPAGRQPADIAPKESGNEWKKDGGRRKVISDDWKHLAKMQVSQPNNIKIYNLSAGKSLPEVWTKGYRYIFCIFGKNRFTALLGHNTCGYSHGQII